MIILPPLNRRPRTPNVVNLQDIFKKANEAAATRRHRLPKLENAQARARERVLAQYLKMIKNFLAANAARRNRLPKLENAQAKARARVKARILANQEKFNKFYNQVNPLKEPVTKEYILTVRSQMRAKKNARSLKSATVRSPNRSQ